MYYYNINTNLPFENLKELHIKFVNLIYTCNDFYNDTL